jgi:hypothetical protein
MAKHLTGSRMFEQRLLLNIYLLVGCLTKGFAQTSEQRLDV